MVEFILMSQSSSVGKLYLRLYNRVVFLSSVSGVLEVSL